MGKKAGRLQFKAKVGIIKENLCLLFVNGEWELSLPFLFAAEIYRNNIISTVGGGGNLKRIVHRRRKRGGQGGKAPK